MLVIADTGALISLGHINKIHLIEEIFGEILIPEAVWDELKSYKHPDFDKSYADFFYSRMRKINSKNYLKYMIDNGESEAIILYQELNADYLLIDDKKARKFAESLDLNCIGTVGILVEAKNRGLVEQIRPIFEKWLSVDRYFSKALLNQILEDSGEEKIK